MPTQIFGQSWDCQFDNHLKVSGFPVNQQPRTQWYLSGNSGVANDDVTQVKCNLMEDFHGKNRRNDVQMTHQAMMM